MTSLSIDSDVVVGYGAVGRASGGVDYGVTSHGAGVTGSAEGGILCYGRVVNNDLWIWSGNVTDQSWECPSPHTHGCRQSHPTERQSMNIRSFTISSITDKQISALALTWCERNSVRSRRRNAYSMSSRRRNSTTPSPSLCTSAKQTSPASRI